MKVSLFSIQTLLFCAFELVTRTTEQAIRTRRRRCIGGFIGSSGCPTGQDTENEYCNTHNCPAWNNWGNWGECTASCGGGTREATRTCNTFGQAGATCSGDATKFEACNLTPCPSLNGWQLVLLLGASWGDFSAWSDCTASCNGGTRTRTRSCNQPGLIGGCPGGESESEPCNTFGCPQWNTWQTWGACSESCLGGTKTATRTCNTFGQAGASCNGLTAKSEPCNTFGCPTWNDMVWNDCSVTCGGGTRTGTRTCNRNGGTADCVGSNTVTGVCGAAQCASSSCVDTLSNCGDLSSLCTSAAHASLMRNICPQTCGFCGSSTGSWSGWSNSGTCTFTCGGGTQRQTRTCNGGTAGATDCSGSTTQTIPCNEQTCPPQGSWGSWTNNGTCSLTCGGGIQQQTRACNGGTAGTGGCPGSTTQTIACNGQACPSSGFWGNWINVGICSASCMQAQTRQCNGGTAGQGGCSGSSSRIQSCTGGTCSRQTVTCGNLLDLQPSASCPRWVNSSYCNHRNYASYMLTYCAKSCCIFNAGSSTGSWSGWSNSGTCTFTCGSGTQRQTRTCNGGTAGAAGCLGFATQTIACNQQACPPQGSWSNWTTNGTCSLTCGGGNQQQTRACNGGTAGTGGCPGSTKQTIACNEQTCQPQGQESWGNWTNNGTCSASCMQAQTRQCNGGTAGQGGCSGLSSRIQSCTGGACPTQTGSCSNLRDWLLECAIWGNFSYCNHTEYVEYMLRVCARSCCIYNANMNNS